jgi:O-methyltransferase
MPTDPPIPSQPREIRATAPNSDPEGLRIAYLDLLKLSLCDLVGVATHMVWRGDGRVFSRELPDEDQRRWRVDGSDWPLNGLTMVGLRRLDDLQACVESVVGDGVAGDLIEAGAWRGGASILMRGTLDTLGAQARTVWVADSFQGFPQPRSGSEDRELDLHMSAIDFLAPSLEEVRGYFARFGFQSGVEFVPGFFEETMEQLRGRRWSVIRLDADGYNATRLALDALYPGLEVGGYLIIDDYFHFHLPVCRRAVDDFRREHGITEPIARIDWTGARWRRETEALSSPIDAGSGRGGTGRSEVPRAAATRTGRKIPSDRELQLQDELAALQARLHAMDVEGDAARRAPRARRSAFARRRPKRGG